jgi:hypothetical protein
MTTPEPTDASRRTGFHVPEPTEALADALNTFAPTSAHRKDTPTAGHQAALARPA